MDISHGNQSKKSDNRSGWICNLKGCAVYESYKLPKLRGSAERRTMRVLRNRTARDCKQQDGDQCDGHPTGVQPDRIRACG